MHNTKKNKEYMNILVNHCSQTKKNIPISSLIIKKNTIISLARNNLRDHAECLAIKKAQKSLGSHSLSDCILLVTVEPCLMCVGAAINADIKIIYFGCTSDKSGIQSFHRIYELPIIHIIHITGYELQIEKKMRSFFKKKRIFKNKG
jgi:tRNA(adenine34) deaminase